MPPFLEVFQGRKEPATLTRTVMFPTALGHGRGYLARPDTGERLPAVLFLHDRDGLSDWVKLSARELSGVGYAVLAVDLTERARAAQADGPPSDEPTLAELSAAVRWLRRQSDIRPERIGVVGWSWGAGQALALAASARLQACVTCDGPPSTDEALLAGLQGTPLLALFAGQDKETQEKLPAFRKALAGARVPHHLRTFAGATAGFMGPPDRKAYLHDAAEQAWLDVYEFLGKYVEDAAPSEPAGNAPARGVARVADLMRAVNAPARQALRQALQEEPRTPAEWDRVRANAAVLAEAGLLLQQRRPTRGAQQSWATHARDFTAAAEAITRAADRHDYPAARRRLGELATRCAACHQEHRATK